MFNFHLKLEMTPITCLRSFGQNKKELKLFTVADQFFLYINHDALSCFEDACNTILEKKKKQIISMLCMIELWTVYRYLKRYFDSVLTVPDFS